MISQIRDTAITLVVELATYEIPLNTLLIYQALGRVESARVCGRVIIIGNIPIQRLPEYAP